MTLFLETEAERAVCVWENTVVDRGTARDLTQREAEGVLRHVWELCRMPGNPPSVQWVTDRDSEKYLPGAMAYVDSATAGSIVLQCGGTTQTVLHEVAHVLTDDPLDIMEIRCVAEHEMHGRLWLANYLWLLDRLMGPGYNTFYLRSKMPRVLRPNDIPFYPVIWGKPRPGL